MGRGANGKKSARPPRRAAPAQGPWVTLRHGLADALRALQADEYLILAAKGKNYFVQFAAHGAEGVRIEAVSNTYLDGTDRLSAAACGALRALGWRPPTYVPATDTPPPHTGSPNFYLDTAPPVPVARLATLAVRTLRTIYGIQRPEELTYKCFHMEGERIRFPRLGLAREAEPPRPAAPAPAPQSGEDAAEPGRSLEEELAAWEGGKPVPVELLEARLRARAAQCEAAHEDAIWQLARFQSMVGRPEAAMAGVSRLLAATGDPEKRAGGYLALGQLLEQQHRFADAEAMYAKGLETGSGTGQVGYFLHNNRGYCLNQLGRHAEAEELCRAAIALDPRRHNAYKNVGIALAGQGRVPEAARALLEADRRCPADPRARRHLADLVQAHADVLEADPALAAACRERGVIPGH
jgi:Tfp pilus assembly protein PilF